MFLWDVKIQVVREILMLTVYIKDLVTLASRHPVVNYFTISAKSLMILLDTHDI